MALARVVPPVSFATWAAERLARSITASPLAWIGTCTVLAALATFAYAAITPGRPSLLAPWLFVVALIAGYVIDTGRARRGLRQVVVEGRLPDRGRPLTARAESLSDLADAFVAVRGGDAIEAERSLSRVRRAELGDWELRVYEGVRALACLEVEGEQRAAKLVPLAIPTRNVEVDRRLTSLLLRDAWDDSRRLEAISRALRGAGEPLADLALLAVLRGRALQGSLGSVTEPKLDVIRAASAAEALGDAPLAHQLLCMAEARGAYR